MVKFLIKRPIAVIMSFLAFIGLGLITSFLLPVSLLPNIDIPEINIQLSYSQLDAENLDKTVVKNIRTQLLQLSKLEDIESESRDGSAIIKLRFAFGTNIDYTFLEVNEQIDALMPGFPKGMERPKVIRARASDLPVFHLNILPKNAGVDQMLELSEFCTSTIKRRIEQLPEVAIADISGLYKPEIIIEPDFDQLNNYGISISQLSGIIKQNNITLANVIIRDGFYQYHVNFSHQLSTINDIENIYLNIDNRLLQLKDLASVKMIEQERNGSYYYNKSPAIVMAIIKQSDARIYSLQEKFESLVQQFKIDYPELEFIVSQDQTKLLKVSISNLLQSLLYGSLMAFLIMFFVLGDLRSPILIGITIPASIIISLLIFYLLGLSINIVSLSGLLLGAGMMIDNSIIVIDNIGQYRQKGLSLFEASIKGTNEVIRPLISSVLTTCAVFIPLVFLSNIAGALFYDQALAIASGLTVSLVVSVMILPVLYHLINKGKQSKISLKIPGFSAINLYEKGLRKVLDNRFIFMVIFLLFIPLGWYLFTGIRKQNLPDISRESFTSHIEWNERNTIDESWNRIYNLQEYLQDTSLKISIFIGEQNFILNRAHQNSSSELDLVFEAGTEKLEIIKNKVEGYIKLNYPSATILSYPTKNIFETIFNTDEPELLVHLKSVSDKELPSTEMLNKVYKSMAANKIAEFSQKPDVKESLALMIDFEKLFLYNVDYYTLISKLKSMLNANIITSIAFNQRMIPIKIGSENKQLNILINNTSVINKMKDEIPLKWLIEIKHLQTYKTIYGGINGTYIPLPVKIKDKNDQLFSDQFKNMLKDFPDLDFEISGTILKNKLMFKELIFVLIISILLLYFILAAQFESVLQPLIILLEVLIDIAGALLLLKIFGASLNIMSAIGIIVMSGIIINDSILKVDTINQLRKTGLTTRDAIFEAGIRRFNPIIMTTLTTILALVPMFFSSGMGVELQKPLALTIIGGMSLGTIVSLYFIPLVYSLIYRKS